MSVVAKYCEECGLKIPQEHFEDGRSISYLYLSYCENCKKKVEKLYNAFQEFASFEAAEEKKSFIYQILVLVVVLVIASVLTFFVTRHFVKSSAGKGTKAIQAQLDNFEAKKKKEIKNLNNKLLKANNAVTTLEADVKRLEESGGSSEAMEKLREERNKARDDLAKLNARFINMQRDRDNERVRANGAEQDAAKWKQTATRKGLGEMVKLQEENKALKAEKSSIESDLADVRDERDRLKASGATPEDFRERFQQLEIRKLILAWAHAINSHDAPTLKRLYTSDSPFGKDSVGSLQSVLDQNDVTLNVKIKKIQADTSTASVDLAIGYRSGRISRPARPVRMTLVKESDRWTIRDEGF